MVKGRRKRITSSKSAQIKSIAANQGDGVFLSPLKKEIKLVSEENDVENKSKNSTVKNGQIMKSPARITSYFTPKASEKTRQACGQQQQINNCMKSEKIIFRDDCDVDTKWTDKSPDMEHFTTDETPVAVPSNDPPTPHRINMTKIGDEDSDIKSVPEITEKESLAVSQKITSQPKSGKVGRGRPKLKYTHIQSPNNNNSVSPNHKVTEYFPVRRSVRRTKKTVLEEKQRDFENKVLCQVEDGLEIKNFPGKGRGIVTTREFEKGEFVVEYIGDLIDQITAKKREAEYANDQNTGCYMYYFQHRGQQYCLDATAESDKLGRLVNHSRNGNLTTRVVEVNAIPHLVLTARENINIGVEVSYDYGDRSKESIRHHPWLAL